MIAPLKVSQSTVQQVAQAVCRGQVEPRATLRALSYFAEEVLFSVFRAESDTHYDPSTGGLEDTVGG